LNLVRWKEQHGIQHLSLDDLKDEKKGLLPVKFVCYETFYRHLTDQRVKLVFDRQPYLCPTCMKIPDLAQTLKVLRAKTLLTDLDKTEHLKDMRSVERTIMDISLHKRQMEIQRDAVNRIKQELKYNDCWLRMTLYPIIIYIN